MRLEGVAWLRWMAARSVFCLRSLRLCTQAYFRCFGSDWLGVRVTGLRLWFARALHVHGKAFDILSGFCGFCLPWKMAGCMFFALMCRYIHNAP